VSAASGAATLPEACAHFLPAVLHNLGMQRWPQLRCARRPRHAYRHSCKLGPQSCLACLASPCCVFSFVVLILCIPRVILLDSLCPLCRPCREAVASLAASDSAATRVMLAGSMHQLAAMVGPSLVVADLLPVIQVGRCR
jgi:hypothetical protein